MTIFIGADHRGFHLKTVLSEHLAHTGRTVHDCGAKTLEENDDYPRYAYAVATQVLGSTDAEDVGILICGSGQGMSIAANRVNGVRAALAWSEDSARSARQDDDANVLVLPASFLSEEEAIAAVDAYLAALFNDDPKYQRRLDELEQLYG